jgi:hypothetical protein
MSKPLSRALNRSSPVDSPVHMLASARYDSRLGCYSQLRKYADQGHYSETMQAGPELLLPLQLTC